MNIPHPFFHDGWIEYNKRRWGFEAERVVYSPSTSGTPRLESVLYLDKRGRVSLPPLQAHQALLFSATETDKPFRVTRQWQEVSALFAKDLRKRGLPYGLILPPEALDVREFQWLGYETTLRFTFHIPLPFQRENVDHQVRKQINKAERAGVIYGRAGKGEARQIVDVLDDTEERQKFSFSLDETAIRLALDLMGADLLRVYTATTRGRISSFRFVLAAPGLRAVDWVAATERESLKEGATQGLINFVLEDLSHIGATAFDFAGANLPAVSMSKLCWGGDLRAYPMIRLPGWRSLLSYGRRNLPWLMPWRRQ
ncbi:MAG: GNAT family N-acetyltransferase [Acidobacteriota bacterium]